MLKRQKMVRKKEACIRVHLRIREDKDRLLFDLFRYLNKSSGRDHSTIARNLMEQAARTRVVKNHELRELERMLNQRDAAAAKVESLNRAIETLRSTIGLYEDKVAKVSEQRSKV